MFEPSPLGLVNEAPEGLGRVRGCTRSVKSPHDLKTRDLLLYIVLSYMPAYRLNLILLLF